MLEYIVAIVLFSLLSILLCDLKNVSSVIEKHKGSCHNTLYNIAIASADNFTR